MKKVGALVLLFLVLLAFISFTFAQENSTNQEDEDDDLTDIEKAFECLEEAADDCQDLTTQELAFTVLAGPNDDVYDSCLDELKDRESSNNWGNIRDTALAILALEHSGEDTEPNEEWLLDQTLIPSELIWYLEQDSNEASSCRIGYDSNDYNININEDKKIDKNAGNCLARSQSNFWLKINPECYENEFMIECDQDFIATLLYKNRNSPTIYVLEGTTSAPAYDSITLTLDSKCFGRSSCDYEGTAWAMVALLKLGYDIEELIPYLVAMSETNEKYLPDAFIYMATNYEDYASNLISDINLGNYWLAPSSSNGRFYDTSLALLSLGNSNSEQIDKSKDWLYFSQGNNGCWQNSVKDTAMVLWALEGRVGKAHGSGSGTVDSGGTTLCSEAGYFCIPQTECISGENVGNNYYCSSLSQTCCTSENLKSCSEFNGEVCKSSEVCTGNERKSSDTNFCCTGECVERQETVNECEEMYYTCMDSCSDTQEPVSGYSCNGIKTCCRTKTTMNTESQEMAWWIWVLIALIIILLAAIGFWFYKKKSKEGKSSNSKNGKGPKMPPRMPPNANHRRPGFPPFRRRPRPPTQKGPGKRTYDRRDPEMSETFKKLREMSK